MSCYFPTGILGQMCNLIVSIPDFCPLSYFVSNTIIQSYIGVQCCLLNLENHTFYRACLSRCISVITVVSWRQCISIHTFLCFSIKMGKLFKSYILHFILSKCRSIIDGNYNNVLVLLQLITLCFYRSAQCTVCLHYMMVFLANS